jgi:hypothetical protein
VKRALAGGTAPDPVLPEHVTGQLSLTGPSGGVVAAGIDVLDDALPLQVTVIVQGHSDRPVPDHVQGVATDARALRIEMLAPGQTPGSVPATTMTARQTIFRFSPPAKGRYTLRVLNLGRQDVVRFDVSAADVQLVSP